MTQPTSPIPGIWQAIYDRLTGDATLMGLVAGVFDHVPEGQAFPYVVIGQEDTSTPANALDRFGRDSTVTLHVWSEYRGGLQLNEIDDRLQQLLDHQPMTVPGHHVVSVRFEFDQPLKDPDRPGLRRRPIRLRINTEQEM